MQHKIQCFIAILAAALLLEAPSVPQPVVAREGYDHPALTLSRRDRGPTLTVMTYNVHGLPWPIVPDRTADLYAIGDRLAAMRRHGDAPQIVVLQEAFTATADGIAARAGYPYVLRGPTAGEVSSLANTGTPDEMFRTRGEGWGAFLPSGLILMSEYPIVQSWHAAFPRADCAGFDCLANKGALFARVAVPGVPVSVQIATAHMNSRLATDTPGTHADEAYVREAQSLNQFIQAHADSRQPLILAADLNVSWSPTRLASIEADRDFWLRGRDHAVAGSIHAICSKPNLPCRLAEGFGSLQPHRRNNDWQIFFDGRDMAVRLTSAALRFQPDPAGRTLSDHEALSVTYALQPVSPATMPTVLAYKKDRMQVGSLASRAAS